MNELQGLVDALAAELDRPVNVDDRRFRALAYSSHTDGIDRVRLASILQREAPREVTTWLESLGIAEAQGYVRVPANADFGMAARVCVPVRFDGTLLGYLWLIDEPAPLSQAEVREALQCAAEVAVELYRLRQLEHQDRERERELLRRLVGRGDGEPAGAGSELLRDGFLASAPAYAVAVLQAFHADGHEPPDAVRVRLVAAAEQVRRGVAPHHLLALVAGEQVIVVLACADQDEAERRGQALAAAAERDLAGTPGWSAIVGLGDERASVRELDRAHEEAQRAVRVGRAVDGLGPLVRWSALGAYRTLASLLGTADPLALLPASLTRLRACADAATLVPTLECYLDRGGDARAAAAALFVHRSSLYGRLRRIEEIAGVDLHAGEDRLDLHIGLRLWRLGGGALGD
ncbi:MAG TPA: helix-turn-helix domain-containing protein [Conexibacter sp.]|nr:helix-turn-helix domain-containing protein [Conexibacter sp.]